MKIEHDLRIMIYQFQKEICYYSKMQVLAKCTNEKEYYQDFINYRTEELFRSMRKFLVKSNDRNRIMYRQKEFTIQELAAYDGANGRPAYVAVNGVVYDVSREATWGGGTHFGLYAGKDLTSQFMDCHKGMLQVLNNLPKIGVLKK